MIYLEFTAHNQVFFFISVKNMLLNVFIHYCLDCMPQTPKSNLQHWVTNPTSSSVRSMLFRETYWIWVIMWNLRRRQWQIHVVLLYGRDIHGARRALWNMVKRHNVHTFIAHYTASSLLYNIVLAISFHFVCPPVHGSIHQPKRG